METAITMVTVFHYYQNIVKESHSFQLSSSIINNNCTNTVYSKYSKNCSTAVLAFNEIKCRESFIMWLFGCRDDFLASPPPLIVYSKTNLITAGWVWVSPSFNLHSQNDKVPFIGPHHLRKFGGKKPKAATKVTLQEPPIKEEINRIKYFGLSKVICRFLSWQKRSQRWRIESSHTSGKQTGLVNQSDPFYSPKAASLACLD